jgi:hypothetical protein
VWFESRTYSQIKEEVEEFPELEKSLVEVTGKSNALSLMSFYPEQNRFNLNDFLLGSSLHTLTSDGNLSLGSFNPTLPRYECSPVRHSVTLGNYQSPLDLEMKNHFLPDEISGKDKFDKALLAHCTSEHKATFHWYFGSGFLQLSKFGHSHNIKDLPWWLQQKERPYLDKLHRYVKPEDNFNGQKTFLGGSQYKIDETSYVSSLEKALFDGEYEIALDIIKVIQPRFGKIDFSKKNSAGVPLIESIMLSSNPRVDSILEHLLAINADPYYNCLKRPNGHMYLGLEEFDYFRLDNNGLSIFDKLRNNRTRFDLMEKILRNLYPRKPYGEEEYPAPNNWEREEFLTKHLDRINSLVLVEGVIRGPGLAELTFDEIKEIAEKLKHKEFKVSNSSYIKFENNYTDLRENLEGMGYENETVKSLFQGMLVEKEFEREVDIIARKEAKKYVDALNAEMERLRHEEVEKRRREAKKISGNILKCGTMCKNFKCNWCFLPIGECKQQRRKCREECAVCSSSADELNNVFKVAAFVVAPTIAIQAGALITGAKEVKEHCSKEENRKELACKMSCSMTVDSSGEARDQRCEVTTDAGEKLSLNPSELGEYYRNQFIKDTEKLNLSQINREFDKLFESEGTEEEILEQQNEFFAYMSEKTKDAYSELELFRQGKHDEMSPEYLEYLKKLTSEQAIDDADWIFDIVLLPAFAVKAGWTLAKSSIKLTPKIYKSIIESARNVGEYTKQGIAEFSKFSSQVLNQKGGINLLWTKGHQKNGIENAFKHWKDHHRDFPELKSAKEYVEKAKGFFNDPPLGTLKKKRGNGDTLFYHKETNTFGVVDKNGTPRTFYKPKRGENYWNNQ